MADTSTPAAAPAAASATAAPVVETNTNAPATDVAAQADAVAADPNLTKAEKKEIQKRLEKFKLKVDGEEIDSELDLNDLEAVKKELQFSKVAQKRMKESNEIRKAAEEFIDILKKDPRKIMKELGVNEKELAQMIMNEELAEMEKSPEQKQIESLQKQLAEIEENKKKADTERQKLDRERLYVETEQKLESDITAALETGGIPKTPYSVKKIAHYLSVALENGIDLRPQDVVPLVRNEMMADVKELLGATNDDLLEEFLASQMPRIRKRNIAKSKQVVEPVKNIKETVTAKGDEKAASGEKKMTIAEFLRKK